MNRMSVISTAMLGGFLLGATPTLAQPSSSRSTPAPAAVVPTVGPTVVIVGETAAPAPPPADNRSRGRSSSRSDATLELLWPRLGAGNANTIDVTKNPQLRLLLSSMRISVPRDGILRKPQSGPVTAPSGSAQPPLVGPITINLEGNYLLPEPPRPDGGPVVISVAGEGGVTVVNPTPTASATRSSTDRRSSSAADPSWSDGSREGETPAVAAPPGPDADDKRPVVTRHDNLPKTAPSFWQALDRDHDAQLSLFEWRTGGKPVDDFLALDADRNGQLELEEYTDGVAAAVVQPAAAPPMIPSSRDRR